MIRIHRYSASFSWMKYDDAKEAFIVSNSKSRKCANAAIKLDKNKGWTAVPQTTLDCTMYRIGLMIPQRLQEKKRGNYSMDWEKRLSLLGGTSRPISKGVNCPVDFSIDIIMSVGDTFDQSYSTCVEHAISQSLMIPSTNGVYYLRQNHCIFLVKWARRTHALVYEEQ